MALDRNVIVDNDPVRAGEPGAGGHGPLVAVVVLLVAVVAVGVLLFSSSDSDEVPSKARSEVCMKVSYETTDGAVPARLCYFPPE